MIITILTLFHEVFQNIFSSSIIGRAQRKGLININLVNIRNYATDKHHQVDDKPYGGGVGMVMKVDVVHRAIENSKFQIPNSKLKERIVLLDPRGKLFNQSTARRYAKLDHLIIICGHYEGIDERISHFVDEKISVGDYILTGGEIPAMVITDALTRLIPGVLTKKDAILWESFGEEGYIEEPHYTRPPVYKGFKVPEILLSGNHEKIKLWRIKHQKNIIVSSRHR